MTKPRPASRMMEVAEAAGVSTATVSRALSDPSRVSSEVRGRVEAAVAHPDDSGAPQVSEAGRRAGG